MSISNLIEVRVDGRPFDMGFESISVKTSMDNISGYFSLSTLNKLTNFPIRKGQTCQILINGISVINGFIEKISISYNVTNHLITIEGRDKTADIIDGSVANGKLNFTNKLTIENLINQVLSINNIPGINVINLAGSLDAVKLASASEDPAENLLSFINRYAALSQVVLYPDGNGNIIINRASTISSGATLINSISQSNKNNILSGEISLDDSGLFNKYIYYSQDDIAGGGVDVFAQTNIDVQASTFRRGSAYDNTIRPSRVFAAICEYSADNTKCTNRAVWEKNRRIAEADIYTYVIQGFNSSKNTIWKVNQLVQVLDDYGNVNAKLLVKSIEFKQSLTEGSQTTITLVQPESFSIQAQIDRAAELSRVTANKYKQMNVFAQSPVE
jgi:prophage tail gpP-like protein